MSLEKSQDLLMASNTSETQVPVDLGAISRSNQKGLRRSYAAVLAGPPPLKPGSPKQESRSSVPVIAEKSTTTSIPVIAEAAPSVSVIAEATSSVPVKAEASPIKPNSKQGQLTRSYASVLAQGLPIRPKEEQNQFWRPDAFMAAETADTRSEPEQKPTGVIERLRSQKQKKPIEYYWPSARHFPALNELPAPPEPPTHDGAAAIPEIAIIRPQSPPSISFPLSPWQVDDSKLTPKPSPQKTTKPSGGKDKASPAQLIAPKPSLFSFDICVHPRCPISRPHDKGSFHHGNEERYLHEINNGNNQTSGNPFGPSNPPPEVWNAWDRVTGGGGSAKDVEIVEGFKAVHGAMRMRTNI